MHRERRWAVSIAALLAIGISIPNGGVAGAVSDGAPATHGRHLGTLPISIPAAEDRSESAREKVESTAETCSGTHSDSAVTACTSIEERTDPDPASRAPGRAERQAGSLCTISNPGEWRFERLSACLREMTVKFTLRGEQQEVLGSAVLYVSSSATLNARSGNWKEEFLVEATQFSGRVASVNVAADVTCTSKCTTTQSSPWTGVRALTDGQVASGTVTYRDAPAAGSEDRTKVGYTLKITQTGTTPTKPTVTWSNPREIRCDSATTGGGNISTGCALPSITPELELPLSTYGAAAATYTWAQWNLPDKWGLYSGKPLTRALDGNARRERTCGSKSSIPFVAKPDVVPSDSCDEFPFASTQEGGTDGGRCAEIVALLENGTWNVYEADPARPVTKTEPCVRGHVPQDVNSLAGTAYSNLIQNQRMVNKDPFRMKVPDA